MDIFKFQSKLEKMISNKKYGAPTSILELHSIYVIEILLNSIKVEAIIRLIPSTTGRKRKKLQEILKSFLYLS